MPPATGQLTEGGEYDVDFDHQFLEAEKYDCKLLPIHRGIAAHGCPLWNQSHGQGQELPVQIHRRACQVILDPSL